MLVLLVILNLMACRNILLRCYLLGLNNRFTYSCNWDSLMVILHFIGINISFMFILFSIENNVSTSCLCCPCLISIIHSRAHLIFIIKFNFICRFNSSFCWLISLLSLWHLSLYFIALLFGFAIYTLHQTSNTL